MAEQKLSSSLLAAVSMLGLSLGVAPVAQAQPTADELAGGGRKGAGCPTGVIGEKSQGGQAGFINEQKPVGAGGAQPQGWSWGASNPASANYQKIETVGAARGPVVGGVASNQFKQGSAQGAVSHQNKRDQVGAYEFYTPKPDGRC